MLTELEPPSDFMERFSEKFVFMSDALPNESFRILLTVLIFDQDGDLGDSRAAKAYLQLMRREFEPMKAAVRSIFSVVRDVTKAEQQAQIGQHWIVQSLKKQLLGREGRCLLHFLSFSNHEMAEFFVDKGFVDFSKHEMHVIPVAQLVEAQSQIVSKPGPIQRSCRTDLIADSRLVLDTLNAAQSNPTLLLHKRNSVPSIQIPQEPPASQRNRPHMYAAKMMRAAVDASSHSASGADSNETLMLKIAALTEEVAKSTDKENLLLKVIEAKDKEISVLQATTTFLMKRCNSLTKFAQSAAVPAEAGSQDSPDIQTKEEVQQSQNRSRIIFQGLKELQRESDAAIQRLKDTGAAPEEIRARTRAAEEALLLAMASNERTQPKANAAESSSHHDL